jgi:iron complex outermembrane receptor protein
MKTYIPADLGRGLAVATIASALSFFSPPARAQTAPQREEETVKLEKFVVTGSFIPVAADAIASPVTLINADDIERTGIMTNAQEVLKKAVPQFQGSANIGSDNANIASGSTGGGSQASLRNLTTLTLINGRRAANSPIAGTGGFQFVDLNIIPLAAIASIEVLLDGASATYGSDATSGVVNIKTRANYHGTELGGFYEWSDNGGKWANRGGSFVLGTGSGKTNVTVAGGWNKQDPLWQFERSQSSPIFGTPTFAGVIAFNAMNAGAIPAQYFVLNPGLTAPPVAGTKPVVNAASFPMTPGSAPVAPGGRPYFGNVGSNAVYWGKLVNGNIVGFGANELAGAASAEAGQVAFDLSRYVTIQQRREARGAIATFDHQLTEHITFFGDVINSKIDTFSQINAQPVGTTPDFNVNGSHPDNPFNTGTATVRVRNRFVTNPREYYYNTTFSRAVGGFRGDLSDRLSFETAVNLNRSELAYRNPGVIDAVGLLRAAGIDPAGASATDHPINMFSRGNTPAAVQEARFVGTGYNDFKSGLRSWDGRLLYQAWAMGGGDVSIVVGGEYRKESLSGTADANSIPDANGNIGWTGATSVNPFSAARDVQAAFAEILLPVIGPAQNNPFAHTLEFDLAVRHEKYSDTDDPTVPKITFRWLPFNDEFAVRGTYGESFNAPTLYNLFGPVTIGFTPSLTLLPFGLPDIPANYQAGGQGQWSTSSNPGLKPAESTSYTFGVVYSPKRFKGFSTELTYWRIAEENIVGLLNPNDILQDVENNGANSIYVRGGPNYAGGNYDVRVDGFGGSGLPITGPGQVVNNIDSVYLSQSLINIGEQTAHGLDWLMKYKWDHPSLGLFDISLNTAYWLGYEIDGTEYANAATVTGGTIPRWRSYLAVGYRRGNWDATLGISHIPKVPAPEEQSGITAAEAYTTGDVSIGYTFGRDWLKLLDGLRVSVGVKNAWNEEPPLLPQTFSNNAYDNATYDAIGRTFVITADFKF